MQKHIKHFNNNTNKPYLKVNLTNFNRAHKCIYYLWVINAIFDLIQNILINT